MTQARVPTGWLSDILGPRPVTELRTNCPFDEEVFAALHYVSEIPEIGIAFLRERGSKASRSTFLLFQGFIRQAQAFHDAAKHLHFRASALMYYYSFLNLVKAYICLFDPSYVSGRVTHGLAFRFRSGNLNTQGIYTTSRGVFKKFYELETSRRLQKQLKLNIVTLLSYCSDVQYEYERAGFGEHRLASGRFRILYNNSQNICWPVLGIWNFDKVKKYKKSLQSFNSLFEEVEPDVRAFREIFDLPGSAIRTVTFFQSKDVYNLLENNEIPARAVTEDSYNACKSFFESSIYPDQFDFKLAPPLRLNLQIPFNQIFAIYALTFYIGSLVRYRPNYLESLLQSKDSWIIERFIRSSTTTFLRFISNMILDNDYVYLAR